jgi:hypothetical protein
MKPTVEQVQHVERAFQTAIAEVDKFEWGTEEQINAQNEPFDLALACGWDWEADTKFSDYALKATTQELLQYGLERFRYWVPVVHALAELNEDAAEQWRVRWTTAHKSDGRECWRVENQEGHLRAEIHPGGDAERNIYAVGGAEKLHDLARALWANA